MNSMDRNLPSNLADANAQESQVDEDEDLLALRPEDVSEVLEEEFDGTVYF